METNTNGTQGNTIKQSFKNTHGNIENYEIEYEQQEENEEPFLGTKDWAVQITLLMIF